MDKRKNENVMMMTSQENNFVSLNMGAYTTKAKYFPLVHGWNECDVLITYYVSDPLWEI